MALGEGDGGGGTEKRTQATAEAAVRPHQYHLPLPQPSHPNSTLRCHGRATQNTISYGGSSEKEGL